MKSRFYSSQKLKAFLFLLMIMCVAGSVSAQYCTPSYTYGCIYGDDIDDFTLMGANSTSIANTATGCSGAVDDRTAIDTVELQQSISYTINLTSNYSSDEHVRVWIDFNNDQVFDASESVGSTNAASTSSSISFSITVPGTAALGNHRMRVRLSYEYGTNLGPAMDPCSNYGYGEAHDYTVTILPAPSCVAPTGITASAPTATTGSASWTASTSNPSIGYYWVVFPQGSGPSGTPVASGLSATTTASPAGLTSATNYTFFVRSVCGVGDSSNWQSANFTTPCVTFVAPFAESFNTSSTPNCWTNTTTPEPWLYGSSGSAGYDAGIAGDHTGNSGYFAWVDGSGSGTAQNITLTSPVIDISGLTNPRLRYYVFSHNVTYASSGFNKLIVEANDNGTWIQIDSIEQEMGATWAERTFSLAGISSPTTQVRFIVDEVAATAFYNDILIDDIYIEETPSCVATGTPAVVTTQGTNTTINWPSSSSAPANGYYWVVFASGGGPSGTPLFSGTEPAGDTTANLTGLTPGTAYTFYVRAVCGAADSSLWKNLNFTPACGNPTGLSVSSITTAGASANWTAAASMPAGYQWRVTVQGSGVTAVAADSGYGATPPVTIANLAPATSYTLYVRSVCSPGDTSTTWISTNFTTQCVTFTAPFAQTFNTNSTPACWTNSGPEPWEFHANGASSSGPDYGAETATDHTGNSGFFAMEDDSSPHSSGVTLTSPVIDISALTSPRLRFYVWSENTGTGSNSDLIIELHNGTGWVPLDTLNQNFGTQWHEVIYALTGITGNNIQLRFIVNEIGTDFENDILLDDIYVEETPACPAPNALTAANITTTSADLNWTENGSATQWQIEWGTGNFTQGAGTLVVTGTKPYSLSSLTASTGYSFFVRAICGPGDTSSWSSRYSFNTLLANDEASTAILLTVGSGCSGASNGTLVGATTNGTEPSLSCEGSTGAFNTVWFKFVAPAGGVVRVSTDYSISGGLTDTKIGVFSATDSSDYNTFTLLACDEDNGSTVNYNSIVYVTNLTPGNTYYIKVDKYSSFTANAPFCIDVMPLTSAMLATTPNCGGSTVYQYYVDAGSGWVSLVDNAGLLIANVKPNANSLGNQISVEFNQNAGAVRTDGQVYYLDRNWLINVGTQPTTPVDVLFFFQASDLAALAAVDPSATVGNLNVTRQTGTTCTPSFNNASGTETLLPQTASGSANSVVWVEASTSGFSNFFIHAGIQPLIIELETISAANEGTRNRVDWKTAAEIRGELFVVERSTDGSNFTEIGMVEAGGTPSDYTFWDEAPVYGINYYRLKLMHANGSHDYSKTVSAIMKAKGSFVVEAYPNPVQDQLTVKTYGTNEEKAMVRITDFTGKEVRRVVMTGNNAVINMSGLASGLYMLHYSDAVQDTTIKINKQ